MALIVSIYALSELNNFAIGDLFVMQAPIHPYQDVKIQVNREDDKHNGYMGEVQSITVPTTTKNEAFVTKAEPEKVIIANQGEAKELHYTQQQQKQKQGEKGSRKSVVIADDLQHHQPQELKPVKSIKSWNFDFSFEPLQIDLMLPSTSELTGSRKKKTNSTNPYRYS